MVWFGDEKECCINCLEEKYKNLKTSVSNNHFAMENKINKIRNMVNL